MLKQQWNNLTAWRFSDKYIKIKIVWPEKKIQNYIRLAECTK